MSIETKAKTKISDETMPGPASITKEERDALVKLAREARELGMTKSYDICEYAFTHMSRDLRRRIVEGFGNANHRPH